MVDIKSKKDKSRKDKNSDLPKNRELAVGRIRSNVSRMKNKPEVLQQYDSIIQDQLAKGIIEKVENTNTDSIKHYLPHHVVINPHKPTTKIRVVYDASSKARKEYKSLNECLYRGPVMLKDLCGLLMRFRMNTVALVADIEKLFSRLGCNQVRDISQDSCGLRIQKKQRLTKIIYRSIDSVVFLSV